MTSPGSAGPGWGRGGFCLALLSAQPSGLCPLPSALPGLPPVGLSLLSLCLWVSLHLCTPFPPCTPKHILQGSQSAGGTEGKHCLEICALGDSFPLEAWPLILGLCGRLPIPRTLPSGLCAHPTPRHLGTFQRTSKACAYLDPSLLGDGDVCTFFSPLLQEDVCGSPAVFSPILWEAAQCLRTRPLP